MRTTFGYTSSSATNVGLSEYYLPYTGIGYTVPETSGLSEYDLPYTGIGYTVPETTGLILRAFGYAQHVSKKPRNESSQGL